MFATRARLLDLIADPVDAPVLVEAGGGMGKTVLADQIVERWPDRAVRHARAMTAVDWRHVN